MTLQRCLTVLDEMIPVVQRPTLLYMVTSAETIRTLSRGAIRTLFRLSCGVASWHNTATTTLIEQATIQCSTHPRRVKRQG